MRAFASPPGFFATLRMTNRVFISRSIATKQSSWIAAVGFAALAMTNLGAFITAQRRIHGTSTLSNPCRGFFALLLMNDCFVGQGLLTPRQSNLLGYSVK